MFAIENASDGEEGDTSMDTTENQTKSTPRKNNESEDANEDGKNFVCLLACF